MAGARFGPAMKQLQLSVTSQLKKLTVKIRRATHPIAKSKQGKRERVAHQPPQGRVVRAGTTPEPASSLAFCGPWTGAHKGGTMD